MVPVDGDVVEILPEEVEVRTLAHSGFAVAAEGGYLAALVTDLTPELAQEGLAREFVRRVQDLRKQIGLDIADRIRIYYDATPDLSNAVEHFKNYIMGETLALTLQSGKIPPQFTPFEDNFDGERLALALEKAS